MKILVGLRRVEAPDGPGKPARWAIGEFNSIPGELGIYDIDVSASQNP
jgi:hypothetical protein